MVELIEILRKDIRLVSTFVEGAYPELGRMGKLERVSETSSYEE